MFFHINHDEGKMGKKRSEAFLLFDDLRFVAWKIESFSDNSKNFTLNIHGRTKEEL
jgi:hypothetical protein